MMESFLSLSSTLTLFALFLAYFLVFYKRRHKKSSKRLPGPKWSLPFLGHLHLMGNEPYKTFLKWKKTYGPMFKVQFGGYAAVVLTDARLIREAFSRPEFSGRPPLKVFLEAGKGKGIGLGNGPLVAEQREFVIQQLKRLSGNVKTGGAKLVEENILLELEQVVESLIKGAGEPTKMDFLFNIPVINSMLSVFLGKRFKHGDPNLINLIQQLSQYLSYEGYVAKLAMFIPQISSIAPNLSGYNKKVAGARRIFQYIEDLFHEPLPSPYIQGQPTNFKEAYVDQMKINEKNISSSFHTSHNMFPYVAGETFMGSMETTSKTLEWFCIYMVRNPEVQQKMYEEIEQNIGLNRLPSLADRPNCAFAEAVLHETMRLSSVGPLGVFRSTTQDALFHGFTIKKGTMVVSNLWGIHHDEDFWEHPEQFNPHRFLNDQGKLKKSESFLPFGVGVRDCVGQGLARDTLFLYMTGLMQRFEIYSSGIVPPLEGIVGVALSPKPFSVIFRKRYEM